MLSSEPYRAMGKELFEDRQYAKEELYKYNSLAPSKIRSGIRSSKNYLRRQVVVFLLNHPLDVIMDII